QASVRYGDDGRVLVIVHAFSHEGKLDIDIPIREGYKIDEIYEAEDHGITLGADKVNLSFDKPFDALAVLLKKN
ncbi:MAG: hypothetical protein K6G22_02275, partial [Lachnospiraceae bacterium]|nr:hypothetical protein [Lachnospiraceae bacterium]